MALANAAMLIYLLWPAKTIEGMVRRYGMDERLGMVCHLGCECFESEARRV